MNISLFSHVPRTCDKCGYKAKDLYEYDAHTWSEDCSENEIEAKQNNWLQCSVSEIKCNFCDKTFAIQNS